MPSKLNQMIRVLTFTALLVGMLPTPGRAQSAIPQPCDDDEVLPSGGKAMTCVPLGWNGQLVVFAHGYIPFGLPLDFYNLNLPDGTSLPDLLQALGFAFATTSYRQNGLAILEGTDDIRELIAHFQTKYLTTPLRTIIAGASEGALVSALLAEQSPELFFSALATCGPIGDFRAQINYFGDFRVLFDYFFPGIIPGPAMDPPDEVRANWFSFYVPTITAVLAANPGRAIELLRVAHASFDPTIPATIVNTALDVLWYNVFAMKDVVQELGGGPFGNTLKWYFGSSNDLRLNLRVQRFVASPTALAALRAYQTTGDLSIPLVALHTTGDDVIPITQELRYLLKFDGTARGRFVPLTVQRYGHCNFTTNEVLGAFLLTVTQP